MKEIIGFTGYFITEDGKVFSTKQGYPRELIPFKGTSRGKKTYLMIGMIADDGIRYKKLIHRLVAQAYILNPYNLPEVNHKDRNIYNNDKNNLEWVTRRENLEQSYNTMPSTRNFNNCFLFKDGELIGGFKGVVPAAEYASKKFGVSKSSLCKYLRCKNIEIRKL